MTRPLAVDAFSDTVDFSDADEIAASPVYRLVASPGPQRLALYAPGRFANGWLGLRRKLPALAGVDRRRRSWERSAST